MLSWDVGRSWVQHSVQVLPNKLYGGDLDACKADLQQSIPNEALGAVGAIVEACVTLRNLADDDDAALGGGDLDVEVQAAFKQVVVVSVSSLDVDLGRTTGGGSDAGLRSAGAVRAITFSMSKRSRSWIRSSPLCYSSPRSGHRLARYQGWNC